MKIAHETLQLAVFVVRRLWQEDLAAALGVDQFEEPDTECPWSAPQNHGHWRQIRPKRVKSGDTVA